MSLALAPLILLLQSPIDRGPATEKPLIDLETEVVRAICRNTANDFAGTLTFVKKRVSPQAKASEDSGGQSWTITANGRGAVRAELSHANGAGPMLAAESHGRRWMRTSQELTLIHRGEAPSADPQDEGRLFIMQTMTNSAKAQMNWVLGAFAEQSSTIEVLRPERRGARIRAELVIDEKSYLVWFGRNGGTLLIDEVLRDGGSTSGLRYHDYRRI